VPYFPQPRALRPEEFDALVNWALGKRYIREKIAFAAATDFGSSSSMIKIDGLHLEYHDGRQAVP
jgi:hypothetical protein